MLTASQIVARVCSICKAPGFTVQCGQYLNLVLSDLVQHKDLKMNRVSTTLTFQAGSTGPVTLESDYLRTYDLFYLIGGDPFFLRPSSAKEFDEDAFQQTTSGYPYEWVTDLSPTAVAGTPGLIYVYPAPSQQTVMTHRYMLQRPDIATPESSTVIPWMPDQTYLIKATAAMLMLETDDERQSTFYEQAQMQLRQHLIMEGDEQAVVRRVEMDPRTFRGNFGSNRPTKVSPY